MVERELVRVTRFVSCGDGVEEVVRQGHRRQHVALWKPIVEGAARSSLQRFYVRILITSTVRVRQI